MSTLHLVDPSARELAATFPVFDPGVMGLEAFRAAVAGLYETEAVPHDEYRAPGPEGAPDVRVLVYRPEEARKPLPAILYLHGGGFVAGSPDVMGTACLALAEDTGTIVVAVNYRLAPETPFPGPIEDCYAALAWLHAEAETLGVDPDRIAVLGQSAGGGLAAALTHLARERGQFRLKAQYLIYPMLDHRTGTPDAPADNPNTGEFLWTRSANRFCWVAMRGQAPVPEMRMAHFAPAMATDFRDLPSAFIAVGSVDLFLEEDAAYALRLSRSGVPVELHVYPGGVHGFDALQGELAQAFRSDLVRAISRTLANDTNPE